MYVFFFSSRRRHTRWPRDWSSDVCSSDVVRARAEELHGSRSFEVVTARAVAALDKLARWTLPLVADGGQLLAMKGSSAPAEEIGRAHVCTPVTWPPRMPSSA